MYTALKIWLGGTYYGLKHCLEKIVFIAAFAGLVFLATRSVDFSLAVGLLFALFFTRASTGLKNRWYGMRYAVISLMVVTGIFLLYTHYPSELCFPYAYIISIITLTPFGATWYPLTYTILSPLMMLAALVCADAQHGLQGVIRACSWFVFLVVRLYMIVIGGWAVLLLIRYVPCFMQAFLLGTAAILWIAFISTLYCSDIHEQDQTLYES